MELQCDCGKFKCEVRHFPEEALGRLVCYCDDCQSYMHYLKRTDILDSAGGTEICPVYPSNFKITAGIENLVCTRLAPKGLFRWSVRCCNTPVANTIPKFPWVGLFHRMYNNKNPQTLAQAFPKVKSRIHGRFAQSTPPKGTSEKAKLSDIFSLVPFLIKGYLLGKGRTSPFYIGVTKIPIVNPVVLTLEERQQILNRVSHSNGSVQK